MKKFQELAEKFIKVSNELYRESHKYLVETLDATENKCIEFDQEDDEQMISVSYNGGGHPEYASNCFSIVKAVYLKHDDLCVSIEETDEYSADELSAIELASIAEIVDKITNK